MQPVGLTIAATRFPQDDACLPWRTISGNSMADPVYPWAGYALFDSFMLDHSILCCSKSGVTSETRSIFVRPVL